MTFFLHQGGVIMSKSDYAHTIYKHIPLRPHTRIQLACVLIFSSCAPFSLPQPHHVTAYHRSPGDNQPEHGPKNVGPCKNVGVKLKHKHMYQGSPLIFPRIIALPPPSSLCCSRPSSPNLTSVNPAPAFHLYPPSPPF